jgi:hypothetical protein
MSVISPAARSVFDDGVSFISIVTDNHAWDWPRARERYESVYSAIRYCGVAEKSEVLCTDNSERPLSEVEQFLNAAERPPSTGYEWCQGFNLLYGLAINRMVAKARYPTVVYFCTNHGRFFDPSWLTDLVEPLQDPFCVMSGSLSYHPLSSLPEPTGGFIDVHVQGGLYAAKTALLRDHPYSYKLPHVFTDLWITWKLQAVGFEVSDVPTIKATGGERVECPERFKYVHDHYV